MPGAYAAEPAHDALARAFASAAAIEDSYRRSKALADVAAARVASGDIAGARAACATARAAAERVPVPTLRHWALHDVVSCQIGGDELAAAAETIERIEDRS
ncbi:MAG TPA: hypothetical protein VJ011_02830, partial [Steroidobacteraceae bacterium]|nr:hypothetical protein [Steroidobacteraceae bacterium]